MANFKEVYKNIAGWEKGYSDHRSDTGNYCDGKLIGTNRGISAILYKEIIGKCPTITQMKNLSYSEAEKIWKTRFWDKLKLSSLENNELAELYVYSIGGGNSGNLHVRQSANDVLGRKKYDETKATLTEAELDEIHKLNETKMFNAFYERRKKFFQNSANKDFSGGLLNRLEDIKLRFISKKKSTGVVLPLAFLGFGITLIGVYLYKKYKR